jgi:hypothetical protein
MYKSYEQPEMLELGAADALTLGGKGCDNDGCDCLYPGTPVKDGY